MLGPHTKRQILVMSKALVAVLKELSKEDHRSLSNLVEHVMRDWVATRISFDRYRHLETGKITPLPGSPEPMQHPRQPLPPMTDARRSPRLPRIVNGKPYGTKKNSQYTDGTYARKMALQGKGPIKSGTS